MPVSLSLCEARCVSGAHTRLEPWAKYVHHALVTGHGLLWQEMQKALFSLARPPARPQARTQRHADKHTHTHTDGRTNTHTHTHIHTHTHTHTRTQRHTNAPKRTHAHARTRTHTHAHARTRTQAHTGTHAHAKAVLSRLRNSSCKRHGWTETPENPSYSCSSAQHGAFLVFTSATHGATEEQIKDPHCMSTQGLASERNSHRSQTASAEP